MGKMQLLLAIMSAPHFVAKPASDLSGFVVAYVGPDQMLPIMSALGAIIGVLLMLWNRVVAVVRKAVNLVLRRTPPAHSPGSAEQPLVDSSEAKS